MKKELLLILMLCFCITTLFFASATKWTMPDLGVTPSNTTINNNTYINQTVNATVNTTQFDSNNPIHIKESWLTSFINSFNFLTTITNIFNQNLNTTSNVTFNNIQANNLNVTNVTFINENIVTANFTGDFYAHDRGFYFNSTSNNLNISGNVTATYGIFSYIGSIGSYVSNAWINTISTYSLGFVNIGNTPCTPACGYFCRNNTATYYNATAGC